MGNKSKRIIQAELNQIRRLLEAKDHNWTDQEIRQKLDIERRTYYRYKNRIEQEDQEIWQKQTQEDKEMWERLRTGPLERRALDILTSMEASQKTCEEIRDDDKAPKAVRLEASKWAVKFRVNIYYLLERGPSPNLRVIYNDQQAAKKLENRRAI